MTIRILAGLTGLVLAVVACSSNDPAPTTAPTSLPSTTAPTGSGETPLYLMLMWHQHQPFYPKNSDGVYTRPWVRVHATKDYLDMAAMLENHPEVTVTFNLTPVLLLQLEELAAGAKDTYWVAAEMPAEELTAEDKRFIAGRFFDVNPEIVARFPRFQELARDRASQGIDGVVSSWDADDFRDLQVLFNLAWTDPDYLDEGPLSVLVEKGEGFVEEDKTVLFTEHLRIVQEVIPVHSRLWEEGRIEITTTPLAHPILPLLADTDLALAGDPSAAMPRDRFREVADANLQVRLGLKTAERLLGRAPLGMWPGEGAVAQEVLNLFSKNGVKWLGTGEDVLSRTLDIGSFERDSFDTVIEAHRLYRPYFAHVNQREPVAMFFRDTRLSDMIGFEYSGMDGEAAAEDFMDRLRRIYDSVDAASAADEGQPVVVSVILDGENAWEHYENDGKEFLNSLYERLGSADWVETITPSGYLEQFDEPMEINNLFPASWFQPSFATWIGEEEEARAWDYLMRTRQDLRRAEQSGEIAAADLAAATEAMLFAEGSDWFWWYGTDQDSGDDGYFDTAFRELLGRVYDSIGSERPEFVSVPIIPERAVEPDRSPEDLATIEVDGVSDEAWDNAGVYASAGFSWIFDRQNLYLRYEGGPAEISAIYLGAPQGATKPTSSSGEVLGFGATHVVVVETSGPVLCNPILDREHQECPAVAWADGEVIELAIPLDQLGAIEAGDNLYVKVDQRGGLTPIAGPLALQVPDISDVSLIFEVTDPLGDDHGPGSYVYPADSVFVAGSFDLASFSVGTEDDEVVFSFETASPIGNPWGSPISLSLQTFDVYIDVDPGSGTGARLAIPGRNAALEEGHGWEYALTIEGWQSALYVADEDGSVEETEPSSMSVAVFGDRGRVVVRLPVQLLGGGEPAEWAYSVALLSQEGFPSPGVRRVRDIEVVAEQWRGGGAPHDVSHTRIFDMAWPEEGEQETRLTDYVSIESGTVDDLRPDELAQLPMVTAADD